MMWRKIAVRRMLCGGLVYRIFIILCNALFFETGLKPALEHFGVLGASVCWNIINMGLYYLYHYTFLRMFKMGKDT
jgi:hypothetical protein